MTQPAPRDAAGTPSSVITVADLLERCRPVLPAPGPGTADVPVAALLHREGRAAATGRGAEPGPTDDDGHEDGPAPRRSASVGRRRAVAAGVLLVVGSVVGVGIATTDAPAAGSTVLDRGTPEGAQLDPVPALPGAGPAVTTDALDPGTVPDEPSSEVALPGPTGAGPAGGGGSPAAGDPVPEGGTEQRGGETPPTAARDDGADEAEDDDPGDERPRDDGGNGPGGGNGNGNGGGKDKDDKGSGDEAPDGGDESPGLVGSLLGVLPDLL